MREWRKRLMIAAMFAVLPVSLGAQEQQRKTPHQGQYSAVDGVADRFLEKEHEETNTLYKYSPLIETYIQDLHADGELGTVPSTDHYFLGVALLSRGVVDRSILEKKKGLLGALNVLSQLSNTLRSGYDPEGFLQMIFVDTTGFNRQNYQFEYVRREFLGAVRCLVFDVIPLRKSGHTRFKGRIWVEDQTYNIVRFNGIYTPTKHGAYVHFDSWRVNVAPGLWLPAYIYSEEAGFKAQTRLWGYNLKNGAHEEEFSQITVESPSVKDQAPSAQDPAPLAARRAWRQQGEENVVDRLERSGLIAPRGDVDRVLETVVNNLEVTNNLDIQPEIRCRVMLTSTLESFAVGHTIVMSRGLLDVLPDEPALAAMLAQQIGYITLRQPLDDKWGFNDRSILPAEEALQRFRFHEADPQDASDKAYKLLKNSPYKDKLASAGLFMRQLHAESKQLPALTRSCVGNQVFNDARLEEAGPELDPKKLDQIAALPLGSRIKLDPWTNKVGLITAKRPAILSPEDKMPFEVAPFVPYLTRYAPSAAGASATDIWRTDMTTKQP
jgi:hypothetical protein